MNTKPDSFHLAAGDGDEDFRQGRASSDAAPSAFTPGPWLLELPAAGDWSSRSAAVRAEGWGVIARIGLDPHLPHWDGPQRANAHLIAAAPELLMALLAMVEWHGERSVSDELMPIEKQPGEIRAAMLAIAKATGEQK